MRRGAGYCMDPDCDEYLKANLLVNHEDSTYNCALCHVRGHCQMERGRTEGQAPFREVRVEHRFNPLALQGIQGDNGYSDVAIVSNEAMRRGGIYTFESPLIGTEKRALKVAEALLANLGRFRGTVSDTPSTSEVVLSFDVSREAFTAKLAEVARYWREGAA